MNNLMNGNLRSKFQLASGHLPEKQGSACSRTKPNPQAEPVTDAACQIAASGGMSRHP